MSYREVQDKLYDEIAGDNQWLGEIKSAPDWHLDQSTVELVKSIEEGIAKKTNRVIHLGLLIR